jgi:hypothetical protein
MSMKRPHRDNEEYGFMERELIFKLLASHALVDRPFFYQLREDPEAAAAQLHIRLNDEDIDYIRRIGWERIERDADEIRDALHLEDVTNSW